MEFEYTTTILVEESDLEVMCKHVKNGEDFDDVFDDVMSSYDDCDYYASDNIYDQVKEEVEKRIKKTEVDKKTHLIHEIENVVEDKLVSSILYYMKEYKDVADYYFIADIFKNKCAYLALKIANELIEADEEDY